MQLRVFKRVLKTSRWPKNWWRYGNIRYRSAVDEWFGDFAHGRYAVPIPIRLLRGWVFRASRLNSTNPISVPPTTHTSDILSLSERHAAGGKMSWFCIGRHLPFQDYKWNHVEQVAILVCVVCALLIFKTLYSGRTGRGKRLSRLVRRERNSLYRLRLWDRLCGHRRAIQKVSQIVIQKVIQKVCKTITQLYLSLNKLYGNWYKL